MTPPRPRPLVPLLLGCALAASLPAVASTLATQTHTASFTGAGGDVRYGDGDTSFTGLVSGLLPLFDSTLGTLERVDITLDGWRSISFTCTNGPGSGSCDARAAGTWVLDGINNVAWSFLTMATLDVVDSTFVSVSPAPNTSESAVSYAAASTSLSFTDPTQLRNHFTDITGSAPQVDYRLRFAVGDGGGFGYGGTASIPSLVWDGDATVELTYHYAAAVPEPEGWAMLAAGVGALAWLRRRRGSEPR